MIRAEFEKPPGFGKTLKDGDFKYVFRGARKFKSRWRLTWWYHCADCDAVVEVVTGLTVELANRRCEAHKNPMMPATKDALLKRMGFVNQRRISIGKEPLTFLQNQISAAKAAATNRKRLGLPKPAPASRKPKARDVVADDTTVRTPRCTHDRNNVRDRGEQDDGRQYCFVWCSTHHDYEWAWI